MPYLLLVTTFIVSITASLNVFGSDQNRGIPAELESWKQWVLHNNDDYHCPFLYNDAAKECVWRSGLDLDINADGLTFEQTITTYKNSWVTLPGNKKYWPLNIELGNTQENIQIRELNQRPQIFLSKGQHTVRGQIQWSKIPRHLQLPYMTGLVYLTLNNKVVDQPFIDKQRKIWLNKSPANTPRSADTVQAKVFRLVSDTLPLEITTQLVLDVSGRDRELRLGQYLLDGFAPISLQSPLPSRIEKNGDIRIQVKPGRWTLELRARNTLKTHTFTYLARDLWPKQEVWAFQAQPQLRQAQVEGVTAIDPQQTQLPAKWRQLPTYLMDPSTQFQLNEQHRGDTTPSANRINIQRDMWLDFSGDAYTVRDTISGKMNRDWRLNTTGDYELGRASANGEPQLITLLNNQQGIEIRQSHLNVEAVSRHANTSSMQASGWQNSIDQLSTQLHLSPGWSLISAQGADYARGSWLSKWNLWDIFLLLIISVSIHKLYGIKASASMLITLILTYQREGAPLFIWLNLAVALALYQITKGHWQQRAKYYSYTTFALLLIISIPFSIDSVRQSFYPQLEHANRTIASQDQSYRAQEEVLMEETEAYSLSDAPRSLVRKISSAASPKDSYNKKDPLQQYDPDRRIQTGPSVPAWRWNQVSIGWNGPVTEEQTLSLLLTPPWLNRIGNIASVAMILLSALLLFKRGLLSPPSDRNNEPNHSGGQTPDHNDPKSDSQSDVKNTGSITTAALAVCLMLGSTFSDTTTAEVLIDSELLEQLEKRLLEPAKCLPSCASIESGHLSVENETLHLRLKINASETVALPLPLPIENWQASSISINQKSAPAILTKHGWLTVIDKGQHSLEIKGSLNSIDQLSLPFTVNAHNLTATATATAKEWRIEGIQHGTTRNKTIELSRLNRKTDKDGEHLQPSIIPKFIRVTRTLSLGLDWNITTRVERISPAKGTIHAKIPLLKGESPTQANLKVINHRAQIALASKQRSVQWQSVLSKDTQTLTLTAEDQSNWVEIWVLKTSPTWHTEHTGIAPIKSSQVSSNLTWQPRPGETISLRIIRPDAAAGDDQSIDQVTLKQILGARSQTSQLSMTLRSSQGGEYVLPLPDEAQLRQLQIDGIDQPIIKETGDITIPVHPGEQKISAHWDTPETLGWIATTPELDLGKSSNNRLTIALPSDRWPLLVGGPAIGPAVLLWGMLIVVLIISAGLGRLQQTPLKTHHWLLLGIGMGTANVFAPLLITGWLLALGWRGQWQEKPDAKRFPLIQIGLISLTVISLISLLGTIPYGLLASPDMHITGNSSSAYLLNWYQDLNQKTLDQAWVISLPMWCYRVAMLAWSLWMALALVQWLGWGWKQLNHLGFWPKKAPTPTAKKKGPEIKLDLDLPTKN